MQKKLLVFLSKNYDKMSNISIKNSLLVIKYKNEITDMVIDSSYKKNIKVEIFLNFNYSFLLDDIYQVIVYVFKAGTSCFLSYQDTSKSSHQVGFFPPIIHYQQLAITPLISEESFTYLGDTFKIILLFKPQKILLKKAEDFTNKNNLDTN